MIIGYILAFLVWIHQTLILGYAWNAAQVGLANGLNHEDLILFFLRWL